MPAAIPVPARRLLTTGLAAAGLALALVLSAGTTWGQAEPTGEQVKVAANAEKVKGHLQASQELYARGQKKAAATHAGHPVEELWSLLEGPLGRASSDLAARVKGLLEKPGQQIKAGVQARQYQATVQDVSAALDDAVSRVVPAPVRESLAFRAGVIHELLEGVEEEYGEAVKRGKIVETVEYQDAYGFFQRARALYQPIAGQVKKTAPGAAREVEGALATLAKAFAGVMPPARPLATAKVEEEVHEIVAELGKAAGVRLAAGKGPVEEIGLVRSGIEQALGAYRAGERQKAEELVTAAYLDHFEKAEDPLARTDEKLMRQIERLIRIELRDRIKARASLSDVEQLARTIFTSLDQAERELQGQSGQ